MVCSVVTAALDLEQISSFPLATEILTMMRLEIVLVQVLTSLAEDIQDKPLDQNQFTLSVIMWAFLFKEEFSTLFCGVQKRLSLIAHPTELLFQITWYHPRRQSSFILMERQ